MTNLGIRVEWNMAGLFGGLSEFGTGNRLKIYRDCKYILTGSNPVAPTEMRTNL